MDPFEQGKEDRRKGRWEEPHGLIERFIASDAEKKRMAEDNVKYHQGVVFTEAQMDAENHEICKPSWRSGHMADLDRTDEEIESLKRTVSAGWGYGIQNRVSGRSEERPSTTRHKFVSIEVSEVVS